MTAQLPSPKAIETHPLFTSSFNQDYTSLAVGYQGGYKLFTLPSADRLEEISHCTDIEEVAIVERLFSSSLVAIVSSKTPRTLNIYHFKKCSEICNYSYGHTILCVKLNRIRVIVCLEESIYIHSIKDMKVLHIIRDMPKNPAGICDLSPSNENCLLAYPASSSTGTVHIYDAFNLDFLRTITAHDTSLAVVAFNESGSKLVTASERGTLIRVFNVVDGVKLQEFRRGMKTFAAIQSLSFGLNSGYVVVSSNKETVHIFKLSHPNDRAKPPMQEQTGLASWMSSAISTSANYLPTQVSDMWAQDRAFATLTLPSADMKTTCVLTLVNKRPVVLVASSEGSLYIYDFNLHNGGECIVLNQHRFLKPVSIESEEEPSAGITPQPTTSYAKALSTGIQGEKDDDEEESDDGPTMEDLNIDDEPRQQQQQQ